MNFQEKLDRIVKKNNSLLCVGLDQHLFSFNQKIIKQTFDLVCAYKPNSAFYEAEGVGGIRELKLTCDYLRKNPEIPVILDAKRGDIGSTNKGYIKYAFDYLGVDAITLHPYLGRESIEPFLKLKDKGFFILCKTSNPGAGEFQDLLVAKNSPTRNGRHKLVNKKLYKYVAEKVNVEWNTVGNCMLVVGATYPKELKEIRKIVGEMTILIPGVGAQGGDIEKTVKAGLNSEKKGIIVNSSRGIIFSENPRIEAEKLRDKINKYR